MWNFQKTLNIGVKTKNSFKNGGNSTAQISLPLCSVEHRQAL